MFVGAITPVQVVEQNLCIQVELEDQIGITEEEVVIHSVYHWTQVSIKQSVEHRVGALCMEQNMKRQTD